MTLDIELKAPLLEIFYTKLEEDGWNFKDCASPLCFSPSGSSAPHLLTRARVGTKGRPPCPKF